jgi:hypothetical protein
MRLITTQKPFIGDVSPLIVFFTRLPSIRFEEMPDSGKVRLNM